MEDNPGPAVFNKTNQTTTVSAGQNSRNRPKHTLVNAGKHCTMFCNYVYIYTYTCLYIHLFIVKIYNQIAKIFVYKHCFCYLNVENVKQKNSLFQQLMVLWLAY